MVPIICLWKTESGASFYLFFSLWNRKKCDAPNLSSHVPIILRLHWTNSYLWFQVLVTGSLHLVGDVLKLLKRWFKLKNISAYLGYWNFCCTKNLSFCQSFKQTLSSCDCSMFWQFFILYNSDQLCAQFFTLCQKWKDFF